MPSGTGGVRTLRTQDTSAPVPNCPQDTSALLYEKGKVADSWLKIVGANPNPSPNPTILSHETAT